MTLVANSLAVANHEKIAYLGPAGAWSHQASVDLYGADQALIGMTREEWIAAFNNRDIDTLIVPVTTSVLGVTPYMDDVLALKDVVIMGEYPKMLSYTLLAKPGSQFEKITRVLAHPVAHAEVKPWMDKKMPHAARIPALTGGAAAQAVAEDSALDIAAMGPHIASQIYPLVPLRDRIEEGPHNVTRWWILGFKPTPPTGHDKTTLVAEIQDAQLSYLIKEMLDYKLCLLTIYERPDLKSLAGHKYIIEIAGHAQIGALKEYLNHNTQVRLLGSYPRKS